MTAPTLAGDALSLVLPCYNEARSLPALVERAVERARRRELDPASFRLVLVENGSADDSRDVIARLQAGPCGDYLAPVFVVQNRGYGWGVLQGLRAVRTPFAAWSHADEQCDPEDVFRGWELLRHDAGARTLVKGRRRGRRLADRLVSRSFETLATAILWRRLREINAQPKVFRADLIDLLDDPPSDFTFDLYVLLRALESGHTIREIDVDFPPRRHGESNWARGIGSRARTMAGFVHYMLRYRRERRA